MTETGYPLHLLDLPIDILSLILEYLLFPNDTVSGPVNQKTPIPMCPCSESPVDPLTVFLIHPSIHAVACPMFYARNTFQLDSCSRHAAHVRTLLDPPPSSKSRLPREIQSSALLVHQGALRRIHRLQLRFDRMRGWIHDLLQPLIEDMILHGDLTHLEVHIVTREPEGAQWCTAPFVLHRFSPPSSPQAIQTVQEEPDRNHIFSSQPVAGMLELLSDPYLRTARLYVDGKHRPEWCRWHKPSRKCLARRLRRSAVMCDDESEEEEESETATASSMKLEIDWRSIIREIDPEGVKLSRAMFSARY